MDAGPSAPLVAGVTARLGRRSLRRAGALLVVAVIAIPAHASEETVGTNPASEAIRAEIEELEERIRELLSRLPPEERDAVRRAILERQFGHRAAARTEAGAGESRPEPPSAGVPPAEVPSAAEPSGSQAGRKPKQEPMEPAAVEPVPSAPAAPELAGEALVEGTAAVPSGPVPEETDSSCTPLATLDTSGDGLISAADRYWRHLYVAREGGSALTREGVESLYEAGARELDLSRRSYTDRKRTREDLDVSDRVTLLFRDGGRLDRRSLVADATGLERAGAALLGPAGEILSGFQVLGPGMMLETTAGRQTVFCAP